VNREGPHLSRRRFLFGTGAVLLVPSLGRADTLEDLKAGWLDPPRSCRPHTRWWWPGSAVTKEGIRWQLEQMKAQGMGGVEICCVWEMYEKGNIPYLSDEWLAMVRHAIETAADLDIEVALTFGPGWDLGGSWVLPEERCKVLAPAPVEVEGPREFDDELPAFVRDPDARPNPWVDNQPLDWTAPDQHRLVAAVAGRVSGKTIDADSLTVLTALVTDNRLRWRVPQGRWRISAFRLEYTGQRNSAQNYQPANWVLDHFNEEAVRRHCGHLNGAFTGGFGDHLGRTVDSYFVDSWEAVPIYDTVLWSNSLLADFEADKGYDLTPYLPALWWDIGERTPRIRYDVNAFLHRVGLERTFRPLIETMARYDVQARIQPHYRFTEEIIEGAGLTPRPETEVTTARFATIADPRKATAAGARFYKEGKWVSAEAYTFLHRERYRTTLEEMKRATDAFLRDGITQLYNHGYVYTPEMGPAPSRDIPWANRISPITPWWPYYKHLAAYVARCCWLLRQGQFVGDVLLYSPQATAWTERVVYWIERRVMRYGNVPQTLVANGYDYDPVNDDVLQNNARVEDGEIRIRDLRYRALILPAVRALPPGTMRVVRDFARAGGTAVALETLPSASVGLEDWRSRDQEVRALVKETFDEGPGHFLPDYAVDEEIFSPAEQTWRPMPALTKPQKELLAILRQATPPDFELEGGVQSDGLTFLHRRAGESDIYFVTNLQPHAVRQSVRFRVSGKQAESWDAMSGEIRPVDGRRVGDRTEIRLELAPWASTLLVFRPGTAPPRPESLPGPTESLEIRGTWRLRLGRMEKELPRLTSWTEDPATRHFSGRGEYEIELQVPARLARGQATLDLGAVGTVAEVWLNGREAGVAWMQPYRLDVTGRLRPGANRLRVVVANTLINQVTGMAEPPPVPPELVPHYGGEGSRYPHGRERFEQERKLEPAPSGLMGPVRLDVVRGF
jgi:hypothetical protein